MKPSRSEASRKPKKNRNHVISVMAMRMKVDASAVYHEAMWVSCANSTLQTHIYIYIYIFVISYHLKSL